MLNPPNAIQIWRTHCQSCATHATKPFRVAFLSRQCRAATGSCPLRVPDLRPFLEATPVGVPDEHRTADSDHGSRTRRQRGPGRPPPSSRRPPGTSAPPMAPHAAAHTSMRIPVARQTLGTSYFASSSGPIVLMPATLLAPRPVHRTTPHTSETSPIPPNTNAPTIPRNPQSARNARAHARPYDKTPAGAGRRQAPTEPASPTPGLICRHNADARCSPENCRAGCCLKQS